VIKEIDEIKEPGTNPEAKSADSHNQSLAVLMPAYNEEEGIALAVSEVCHEVLDLIPGSYLIVVNDGSKDRTGPILDDLAKTDSRVRVIHKPNGGHGPALVKALNSATTDYVFTIDSDMQIPLSCFPELWKTALQPDVDGVFGIRMNRQDPKARLALSVIISFTLGAIFKVRLVDTNIPCKIFRREIWSKLYNLVQDDSLLAPSIAIAIYARRHNYRIVDVPVPHRARTKGESSLKIKRLLTFCWNGLTQLWTLKDKIS